ncbi:MAG: hypothetical protein JW863_17710 [Chitinispirillaceae bacterium]|nr:hypothetical protein [Chitinispirillaceae bacterium]
MTNRSRIKDPAWSHFTHQGALMDFTKPYQVSALLQLIAQQRNVDNFTPDGKQCTAEIAFSPKKKMSVLITMVPIDYNEWRSNYTKKMCSNFGGETFEKPEIIEGTPWENYYEFTNKKGETAIAVATRHFNYANLTIIFYVMEKDEASDTEVTGFLSAVAATLEKPELESDLQQKFIQNKPSMIGPVTASLLLGIMALINFSLGEEGMYALRGRLVIPGVISGAVLLVMAISAFFRKIRLTYYFMIFSVVFSLISLITGMKGADALPIYFLLEAGVLATVGIRCKDFGYDSFKNFISNVIAK